MDVLKDVLNMQKNLWAEVAEAMKKDPEPSVVIQLAGDDDVFEGVVLKVVEGWVKVKWHDYDHVMWVNMDYIVTWRLLI